MSTDYTTPHPLSEYEQVKKLIEAIDADPGHKLPEGISGIVKLAKILPDAKAKDRFISGFIYYDVHKRFIDGYPINSTRIAEKLPGGIYKTTSGSSYLVEVIC